MALSYMDPNFTILYDTVISENKAITHDNIITSEFETKNESYLETSIQKTNFRNIDFESNNKKKSYLNYDIRLDKKQKTIKRTVKNMIDVFADVGGIGGVFFVAFEFIIENVAELLFLSEIQKKVF